MAKRILKNGVPEADGTYYEFDTDVDHLGEGGMGVVYLGKRVDHNGIETKVAIKVLKCDLSNALVDRARREASIQLNSDNLVRMYGFIEEIYSDDFDAKRVHYHVISEYLEGVALNDFVEGRLAGKDGIIHPTIQQLYDEYMSDLAGVSTRLIKQVLSGVMSLHDNGYIHRDIDPSNIMITYDGNLKLIDFGIAKPINRLSTVDKELTASGQFLGKAGFASPEQVLGDVRSQTYATDVYSIGILYFYLMTGHLPFDGSSYEMLNDHLNKKVPLREIYSRGISRIIKKATSKKIAERYASVAQMRAAVDDYVMRGDSQSKAWAITACAVSIFVLGFILLTIGRNDKSDAIDIRYMQALRNMDSPTSITAVQGLDSMKVLAAEGYQPAMLQLVKTYLPVFHDTIGVKRRLAMNIAVGADGVPTDAAVRNEAMGLLTRYVDLNGGENLAATMMLGNMFFDGKLVERNIDRAIQYYKQGYDMAMQKGNTHDLEKFEKAIQIAKTYSAISDKQLNPANK